MKNRLNVVNLVNWWNSLDLQLLSGVIALILLGVLFTFSSSPAAAYRLGIENNWHFAQRHALYAIICVGILFIVSFFSPRIVRRVALIAILAGICMMLAALIIGPEVKGTRRWFYLFGFSIQPSEALKPGVLIVVSWLLSQAIFRPELPAIALSLMLVSITILLYGLQPDIGHVLLFVIVISAVFILAGLKLRWMVVIISLLMILAIIAYFNYSHVQLRIDRFFFNQSELSYQNQKALECLASGGLYGQGPGEGFVKYKLPDAHTDYIFSVIGEEYGALGCIFIIILVAWVFFRGIWLILRERDAFSRLCCSALIIMYGLQSVVHILVNLSLIPPKGVTLPFISFGGSSLLSTGFSFGVILALTSTRRVWKVDPSVN